MAGLPPLVWRGAWGWAGEKLVLTVLEGRFRDACFCCAME
jgi:hypothetical protein